MSGLTTHVAARILREAGFEVRPGADRPITGGAADSRLVQPGDLFAAYPGEQTDGNEYVDAALEAGAVAAVCNRPPRGDWPDRTVAVVPDSVRAMAALAGGWRRACPATVVGITGTVGKTTAKEFIADVLSSRFRTHRSGGNFNSREGLPLALLTLRRDDEASVLEIAMDSRGEIAELCAIVRPRIGVVLNVGLTHVSKLGSIEAIQEEKLSLARSLPRDGVAVLNAADPRVAPEAERLACRVITFGAAEGAGLRVCGVEDRGLEGVAFTASYEGGRARVESHLPGAHTLPAAAAALAVGIAMGMTLQEVARAASAARTPGRSRILRTAAGGTVIDDRYNSSPASLAGALAMLATTTGGRRIALLGRMAELGDHEEEEHRKAGTLAARSCDLLVATGEPCVALVEAARAAGLSEAHWFAERDEAAAFVRAEMRPGDTTLVKASRSQAFEEVIPVLLGGGA